MSCDTPGTLSASSTQMNTESRFHHPVGPELPSSHLPIWNDRNVNEINCRVYDSSNLSFVGPLCPAGSQENPLDGFTAWMRSPEGCFPSQSLPDPSPPSPSVPNHNHPPTLDSAAVGGYGSTPGSQYEQSDGSTPDPAPTVKFAGRKNTAHDIWPFTRAVKTASVVPDEEWLDDYNDYLVERPEATFVGCKLCTQFG